jgi:ribonuclease HI
VNKRKCKSLLYWNLFETKFNSSFFCTKAAQRQGTPQNDESEPDNRLDDESRTAHLSNSATNDALSGIATGRIDVISELVAFVDGGCLGNPGPSGIGVVIQGCASGTVRIAKWIGQQDNNVAEYAALMEALQYAVSRKAQKLHVYSDSQVVVRQMTGEYKCRSSRLYSLHWTCLKLARSLNFSISHVPRENNVEANGLVQAALKLRTSQKNSATQLRDSAQTIVDREGPAGNATPVKLLA